MTVALSLFSCLLDTSPELREFRDWQAATDYLCQPRAWGADKHPGWSPARFNGTRANANVTAITAIVWDYDQPTPLEDIRHRWQGVSGSIISTKSWSADSPRWRVLLHVSRDMTPEEYRAVWRRLKPRAGPVDDACSDPARFWWAPGSPLGLPTLREDLDGEPLDVDAILAKPDPLPPPGKPVNGGDTATKRALTALDCECGNVARSAPGERHRSILHASLKLKRLVNAGELEEALVIDGLLDAANRCGELTKYGEPEVRRWIADGFEYNEGSLPTTPLKAGQPRSHLSVVRGEPLETEPPVEDDPPPMPGDDEGESEQDAPAPDPWQTTTERLRALSTGGRKLRTGLSCIDALLRGGVRTGRLFGIGGGPHAGKTTLCAQIADNMGRDGVAVAFIAYDEASDGIDSRLLQAHGCGREETEEPTDHTFEVAEELDRWPCHILEPCNVEDAADELAKRYPDLERVLIVDSIQRARTARSSIIVNPRERVDDVLETLKRKARTPATRCLVIFTSELNRGAYRNRDSSENVDDMAAGKESGAIEYHADIWMVIRWESGEQGRVTVAMAKNRVGSRTQPDKPLELQLDQRACQFLVLGEDAQEELRDRAQAASLTRTCRAILDACRKEQGLTTTELKNATKANRTLIPTAMRLLVKNGQLVNRGTERKAEWWTEVPNE